MGRRWTGMVAYFARRLVSGLATILAATLVLYSLLISPGIPAGPYYGETPPQGINWYLYPVVTPLSIMYGLDEAWPGNYLSWLYGPNGTATETYIYLGRNAQGTLKRYEYYQFTWSGLIRGDF